MDNRDLKLFDKFLKLSLRRSGDRKNFLSIPEDIGITGPRKVDMLNRLMLLFTDIPPKLFADNEVRITLLEDYRRFIHEITIEEEIGEAYQEEEAELDFEDVMDMFDFD